MWRPPAQLVINMTPPHRAEALSDDTRVTSVCLSVAYIGPKSRTERPRKTKIGAEVAHVTCDSDTTVKVKSHRSACRGRSHILCGSLLLLFCVIVFIANPPPSVWPHLFCGAGHEKRRGKQLKWSLAFRLYIGSFTCAQLPGPVHTVRLGRLCFLYISLGLYLCVTVCIALICLCVPILLCFPEQLSHLPYRFWRWRN